MKLLTSIILLFSSGLIAETNSQVYWNNQSLDSSAVAYIAFNKAKDYADEGNEDAWGELCYTGHWSEAISNIHPIIYIDVQELYSRAALGADIVLSKTNSSYPVYIPTCGE